MTDLPSRRWKPPREETVAHAITPSGFCQTQIKTTDSDSRPALIHGYGECGQSARIQRQFPNLAVFTNSELFSCHFFFFCPWSINREDLVRPRSCSLSLESKGVGSLAFIGVPSAIATLLQLRDQQSASLRVQPKDPPRQGAPRLSRDKSGRRSSGGGAEGNALLQYSVGRW